MEKTIIFNYTSEVVGICGDQIIIEASIDNDEYGLIDKSIVLKKDQYTKLMDKWLEEKKDYCERYEYNCGEGYILGTIDGELKCVTVWGEEYIDCSDVRFTVDLEHG